MVVADTLRAENISKFFSSLHSHCIFLSLTAAAQSWGGQCFMQGWRVTVTAKDRWHSEQGVTQTLSLCCQPSPGP